MSLRMWWRAPACAAVGLSLAACQSFDVEDHQFAIIAVPMSAIGDGVYITRPSAFFFEGIGVRLATTQVGTEGCIEQDVVDPPPDTFDDIDAGDALTVEIGEGEDVDEGILTPSAVGARILYQLPSGQSLPITPGELVTVTVPGAPGGFPARVVSVPSVADFTPDPVTVPTSTTADMNVTWGPLSPTSGTAMFYSFQYATEGETLNKEVACVFSDDGSGTVSASLIQGFRGADVRVVRAQRARISVERIGSAISHYTSSLVKSVAIVGDE